MFETFPLAIISIKNRLMKSLGEVSLNQTVRDQAEKFSRIFENEEMNFADVEFKKLNWKEDSYTAYKDDLNLFSE